MTSPNDISVVIPCFNHADVLRRTIESVRKQTVQPAEIVIVDDGSTDDPEATVGVGLVPTQSVRSADMPEGEHKASPLRWVHLRHNHGAPFARNEGARLTSAPYILFLDADAELVPDALETFLKTLQDHPDADFAYANFFWGAKRFRLQPFDPEALKKRNYIHTSSLVRRSAFPGFDESLKKFQDWDLWLTMAERGSKGVWIDRELMRIEPRRQGMSRWLPKIAYLIPWQKIGYQPREIGRYREAEAVVRKKHQI